MASHSGVSGGGHEQKMDQSKSDSFEKLMSNKDYANEATSQLTSPSTQPPSQDRETTTLAPTTEPEPPRKILKWTPPSRKRKKVVKPKVVPPPPPTPNAEADGAENESKKGSWVWSYFTRYMDGEDYRAFCNLCKADYAAHPKNHGTGNLISHLLTKCKKFDKKPVDAKQKTLVFGVKKEGDGVSLTASSYSYEESRKRLAEMVILDEYAFRCVEGDGFKAFVSSLQPNFKLPSRVTVARDVMKVFKEEKKKLKKLIKSERVCLTTDTWTSIQNKNYMCLTAHWIDSEWKLQKRILSFCIIHDHKGRTIGKMIEQCMLDWGIDKLLTITVDNARSNDGAIKYIKKNTKNWETTLLEQEFLHLRCSAHILNLVVKDGLKKQNESIIKIRNAVRYVRSSPNRLETFRSCAAIQKIESKSLVCLDVETRWNSTYLMLEAAVKFEKAFERLREDDLSYKMYFSPVPVSNDSDEEEEDMENEREEDENVKKPTKNIGPPCEEDWIIARSFLKFLKLFYGVTKKFSGTLHVTANLFFYELVTVLNKLNNLGKENDDNVKIMATSMKTKFAKYWESFDKLNLLLFVATILDPRYKLEFLNYGFDLVYDQNSKVPGYVKKHSMELLISLFRHYENSSQSASNLTIQTSVDVDMDDGMDDLASQFAKRMEENEHTKKQSEIAKYLAEGRENPTKPLDVLMWWQGNASRFPILSQVARVVLAIPVSTVASESAFSTSGRILDPFRSSLNPELVEALVCGQNWLRSTPKMLDIQESMRQLSLGEVEEYEEVVKESRSLGASTSKA